MQDIMRDRKGNYNMYEETYIENNFVINITVAKQ